VRTWLYRIATNVCLTALQHHDRRYLPSGLGAPSSDPSAELDLAPEVNWLQPLPSAVDPADIVAERNHLRLALIVSLQHLPPQQRAVLVLREVLAFPAAAVAEMLEISVAAVKSSLQRARATLNEVAADHQEVAEPSDARAKALLDQYIAAFENSDAAALEKLLRRDTVLEATPSRTWFSGLATCLPYLVNYAHLKADEWRMIPTSANGQPAAAAYQRTAEGVYEPFGIVVLTVAEDGLARITVFGDPSLFPLFSLPSELPAPS
jgi:RNA polymerase sigma-70 factor (ECF subfamily)